MTQPSAAQLQHRAVLAALHDGVVVQAATGEILEANLAARRMLGLSVDEMAGRMSLDPRRRFVQEDGTPFAAEDLPAMVTLRTGASTTEVVMGVHRPAGDLVWLSINSEPLLRAEDGAVVGAVTSFSDITSRRRTESALRENEQRLREAQRVAGLGSLDWDLVTNSLILSDETLAIYGLDRKRNAVALEDVTKLLHPDDRDRVVKSLSDAVQGTARHDMEHRMVRPDGNTIYVRATAELFRDAAGRPARLLGVVLDVTEQKRAAAVQEATERRLALVLDKVTDGVFTLGRDWRYVYINPSGAHMVGRTPEALVGRVYQEVWPEAVGSLWERTYREAMDTGEAATIEDYYAPLDQWFEASVFPFAEGISVFFRDISLRKRAERTIESERERLKRAEATAHNASWELDLATNEIWWSDEMFRIQGLEPGASEPSFEVFLEAVHPDDRALVSGSYERLGKYEPYDSDHRLQMRDERVKHVRSRVRYLLDERGRPFRAAGTIQDVTELVQIHQRLRDILDSMLAFVALIDLDGNIVDANRTPLDAAGLRREDVIGTPFATAYWLGHSEQEQRRFLAAHARAARGEIARETLRIRIGDSAFGTFDAVFGPLRDASGAVVGVVSSAVDVTERVAAEAELRRAELRIAASLREKETLLREIHHRVKNNLQVIAGLLYFQSKRMHAPEDVAAVAQLRQRIFAMTLLHERLYESSDVARIDFGVYVRGIVTELLRSVSPGEGIRIHVSSDEVLLPIELAMPSGLILSELVTNVLKYAFPGAGGGSATVSVRMAGDRVVLGVDDDGVGLPRGFDAVAGGSFGWELVRALVMQLGGTVEATGSPGAHVRVSFPAPAPSEEAPR